MHRIATAALAVFIAALFAAAPIGADRAEAQAERAATTPANPRDRLRAPAPNPTMQEATNSISCRDSDGKTRTYTVSVTGGSCFTFGSGSDRGVSCTGSGSDEAAANCWEGCGDTHGEGSCTQTTN